MLLPFKFQYDNTLSPKFKVNYECNYVFKFQYDNTLSYCGLNVDYKTGLFKFQYDNTLSSNRKKDNS